MPPVMVAGELSSRYQSVEVNDYVNLDTGEVIQAADSEKYGIRIAGAVGHRALQRDAAMSSLKPESRAFARFCLQFRNRRRGVTPGFHELCRWYSELTGKRVDNVRRYLPSLKRAGIMAGESLLGPLFQFAGKSIKAHEHAGEDRRGELTFRTLLAKARNEAVAKRLRMEIEASGRLPYVPEWDAVRFAEHAVRVAFDRYVATRDELRQSKTTGNPG
ncbi:MULTISPECIES: hypothetical protein [Burkholderia]|uniref:hypothetical protein n=1 Tax=Burkholderia TaxID=32008 RepID=UPI0012E38A5F|nr:MULTISPECIES: hypothetical protein [Burkholderia]